MLLPKMCVVAGLYVERERDANTEDVCCCWAICGDAATENVCSY